MLDILSSWWTVGGGVVVLAGLFASSFTPWGRVFLATRVGRWVAGIGVALLLFLTLLADARSRGKREAIAGVRKANAAAKKDREKVDAETAKDPLEAKRKELGQWSRD